MFEETEIYWIVSPKSINLINASVVFTNITLEAVSGKVIKKKVPFLYEAAIVVYPVNWIKIEVFSRLVPLTVTAVTLTLPFNTCV